VYNAYETSIYRKMLTSIYRKMLPSIYHKTLPHTTLAVKSDEHHKESFKAITDTVREQNWLTQA